MADTVKKVLPFFFNYFTGAYFLWVLLHYASAHLYTSYCANWSILGFLFFPITAITPWCKTLSWIIQKGTVILNDGYTILGTYFTLKIANYFPNPT
jgi:hypothetical protein|tara:strand:- start:86 stop:373 length:288 start_codon:yes stop_codon:yes gene_type:complete